MALRLGPNALRGTILCTVNTPSLTAGARQLVCSVRRCKEVASQEEIPNLRHAQRPRQSLPLLILIYMLIVACVQPVESFMPLSSTQQTNTKRKPQASIPTANISSPACPNTSNNSPSGKTSSQFISLRTGSFPSSPSSNTIPQLNIQWWRILQL